MKFYHFILIFWATMILTQESIGRNLEKSGNKFSIYFGIRDFKQPPLNNTDKLDFFDHYLSENWDKTNYTARYEYLGFGYSRKWSDAFESDFRFTTNSTFTPNTLYLNGIYYPKSFCGISLSYYLYPQLLNDYSDYFQTNTQYQNMYAQIVTEQYPQWSIYDHTFAIGLISPLNLGPVHLRLGIHTGLMFITPFETTVWISDRNSYYQSLINYHFTASTSFFIKPEASLNIDLVSFNKKTIGLQIQTSWLSTKRSINYKETQNEWTLENTSYRKTNGAMHKFEKFEFDGGLVYKW